MTLRCECKEDGFCERYQRHMGGRMREICQGINVDLGTAVAFREQWASESKGGPTGHFGDKSVFLLKTNQAPGDAVAMTAAIYSLHEANPGRYITLVESEWPEVFKYNPNVPLHVKPGTGVCLSSIQPTTGATTYSKVDELAMHYPAIHKSNERGIHFMQGWCEFLSSVLEVPVPLLTNRPHLYFKDSAPPVGDFWLICAGGKTDFTAKLWGKDRYQKVVQLLDGKVRFIQVGHATHDHPYLEGVQSEIGNTTLRGLFKLARKARGIVCGVSLLMHVAAALEKPAIVIAGGREPVQWNAYPKQHYLHTIGSMPCTDRHGRVGVACWRSCVTPRDTSKAAIEDSCQYPAGDVASCMTMITPEQVADLVLKYDNALNS